jgi:di/tricarboxylate transporter
MLIWLVTLILVTAMLLLITEKLPVDLTSIGIVVVLTITGILTPTEAIAGFASPAVITVGAMFMISKGMIRTGAVGFISQKVSEYSRGRPTLAIFLIIIAMIALSVGLEKTGASEFYARIFLSLFSGLSSAYVLSGVILLTSISTHVLSNNAAAILLLPIAISAAQGLGIDPKPFIIAVCFGASACFATPIGYQTNLLVYGPGGYRFSDFFKLGMPLNLLVLLMGSLFIPLIWPF